MTAGTKARHTESANGESSTTELQRTPLRVTPSLRFLVAGAAAAAIAVTGTLAAAQQLGAIDRDGATRVVDTSGAVASGAAWEAQRAQQSVAGLRLERIRAFIASERFAQMGAGWQERYEQMYPVR